MEKNLLLLYPALLLVLTFFGAKRAGKHEISGEFLSLKQAKLIQASACLGILLHHLTQSVTNYAFLPQMPITILNFCGFLFTAIFFFFSGYGLLTSLQNKPGYLSTFLQRRLVAVLVPFWIINALGVVLLAAGYGISYTWKDALSDIFGLTLVNSNGWFIIEIVVLYIVFFVLFSLFRNRDLALVLLCIFTVLLIVFASLRGHDVNGVKSSWFKGEWWYNSTIAFPFGLLFARFRERLIAFFNRRYPVKLLIVASLFVVLFILSVITVSRYGYYHTMTIHAKRDETITLISQSAAATFFVLLVVLLNMKITLGNRVLSYIGGIAMELFLVHGYFVNQVFGEVRMNAMLRFACVIASSIACAAVLSPLIRLLVKKITGVLTKKRIVRDTLEGRRAEEKREKTRKMIRTGAGIAVLGVCVFALISTFVWFFRIRYEYGEEMETIRTAEVGDRVCFGYFDTDLIKPGRERLSWIVAKKDGDRVCLLCEQGISGSAYHKKHEEVTWEDADIRSLINSGEFAEIFSNYEMEVVCKKDGDVLTLLTPEEAAQMLPTDTEREASITDVAMVRGTNANTFSKDGHWDMKGYRSSWWWLKGEEKSVYAPYVTSDGEIILEEKEVNRPNGAIRPVVWVDLSKAR